MRFSERLLGQLNRATTFVVEGGSKQLRKLWASSPLLVALVVAAVILAGTATYTLTTQAPRPQTNPNGLPPGLPRTLCDPRCDMEIRVGPEQVNEVDLQVNPTDPDNIVAAANDYAQPSGAHWVGAYWSKDRGRTWQAQLLPGYPGSRELSTLTGMGASGDPAIAFDSAGNVYLAGIAFAVSPVPGPNPGRDSIVFVAKSSDGGATYSQISVVARAISRATFHDKEWIAVDPTTNNIYVVWVRFNGVAAEMVFSRSTDGGLRWSIPRIISDASAQEFQIQGAYPVVTADGVIHITWADFATGQFRYVRSTDQGGTFSSPVNVANFTNLPSPLPNSQFRSALLPQTAADTGYSERLGSLYLAWNDYRNNDSDVYLVYSRDGGSTWSEEIRVNTNPLGDGTDQFMPDIAVTAEGYVILEWYDRRDDPNNTLIRPYFGISTDGGQTFVDIPVADAFNGDNGGTSFFSGENHLIGDYIGISSADGVAFLSWADTRNGSPGTPDSDIYGARVKFA